jgi:pyridoxine 5-phosphate synthase
VRVSLFMDPIPEQMAAARPSAPTAWSSTPSPLPPTGERPSSRAAAHAAAAQAALDAGLGINAGHDLNRDNLPAFVARVPGAEVSIGHALIADALELGYAETAATSLHRCRHGGPG